MAWRQSTRRAAQARVFYFDSIRVSHRGAGHNILESEPLEQTQ